MKTWAGFTWGVAAIIAGLACQGSEAPRNASWVYSGPKLVLGLAPVAKPREADEPAQASAVIPLLSAAMIESPVVRGASTDRSCARLGIFPDVAWASRVAMRLSPDHGAWQIKSYPGARHYVEFRGMTRSGLDAKLTRQRPVLKGLISQRTRAEACP